MCRLESVNVATLAGILLGSTLVPVVFSVRAMPAYLSNHSLGRCWRLRTQIAVTYFAFIGAGRQPSVLHSHATLSRSMENPTDHALWRADRIHPLQLWYRWAGVASHAADVARGLVVHHKTRSPGVDVIAEVEVLVMPLASDIPAAESSQKRSASDEHDYVRFH